MDDAEFFDDTVGVKFINTEGVTRTWTSYILYSKRFTETSNSAIFTVPTMEVGKYDIVLLILREKNIDFFWDIVYIIGMLCFSDKGLEAFITS
jgi:hypothetical protein